MVEAIYSNAGEALDYTPTAALVAGQVVQLADGRAAVATGAIAAGAKGAVQTCGVHVLAKSLLVSVLNGDPMYWDISAGTATPLKALGTGDHFIGLATEDSLLGTETTIRVALNVQPHYLIDFHRDAFESLIVKTVVGSTTILIPEVDNYGGAARMFFGLTAEAQKLDLMSKNSVPTGVPFIVEGRFAIYDISDNAAADFNIGIANATHTSDADSITEYLFIHLDGTSLNLMVQSKDGGTTNASADSTLDAVDDTFIDFRIDCRTATAKLYINAVRVMDGTTGAAKTLAIGGATGPWKLLAHMEKTSDDGPGDMRVSHFAVRTMEQAA